MEIASVGLGIPVRSVATLNQHIRQPNFWHGLRKVNWP